MEIPYTRKSLIQGIIYTRGTPCKYKGESLAKGNQLETRVKWMPYSTKERIHVRAFSRNQVYIWTFQKPPGKPKKPKQPKRSSHRENKKKQTFRPMSAQVDMGLKVCFLFSQWFWYLLHWPLWLFWFLWFSPWLLMLSNCCIVRLSVCLETIKLTCSWYTGFPFITNSPW